MKSKDFWRIEIEQQQKLRYLRERYYLVETTYHMPNFSDFDKRQFV